MFNNSGKPLVHTGETTCPICGQNNNCKHNEECWCFSVTIPKEILETVPKEKRGKACICKSCVEKYRSE